MAYPRYWGAPENVQDSCERSLATLTREFTLHPVAIRGTGRSNPICSSTLVHTVPIGDQRANSL